MLDQLTSSQDTFLKVSQSMSPSHGKFNETTKSAQLLPWGQPLEAPQDRIPLLRMFRSHSEVHSYRPRCLLPAPERCSHSGEEDCNVDQDLGGKSGIGSPVRVSEIHGSVRPPLLITESQRVRTIVEESSSQSRSRKEDEKPGSDDWSAVDEAEEDKEIEENARLREELREEQAAQQRLSQDLASVEISEKEEEHTREELTGRIRTAEGELASLAQTQAEAEREEKGTGAARRVEVGKRVEQASADIVFAAAVNSRYREMIKELMKHASTREKVANLIKAAGLPG